MSEKEFSLEQSEELIANLKSGAPSEFEQLRSTLNLLAHVPEISPVATPPILPSSISQPAAIVPIKSSKPRRTIVTSIVVMGLFASGSLAAAAVTGIGPAIFVNAGHSAAKFVKNVVGGVSHVVTGDVVTGNVADTSPNQPSSPLAPVADPSASPAPISKDDNNQSDSEKSALVLPLLSNLFPLVSPTTNSHENESQKPNSSHETQGPNSEDSHPAVPGVEKTQSPNEDQNQSDSHPSDKPKQEPTAEPSSAPTPEPTAEPSSAPTPEPTAESDSENQTTSLATYSSLSFPAS